MTDDKLTEILAKGLMGWRVARDRILMDNRKWTPLWRFQPTVRIADAFKLVGQAAPDELLMKADATGAHQVQITIGGRAGTATDVCQARAVTIAIARAIGLDV